MIFHLRVFIAFFPISFKRSQMLLTAVTIIYVAAISPSLFPVLIAFPWETLLQAKLLGSGSDWSQCMLGRMCIARSCHLCRLMVSVSKGD